MSWLLVVEYFEICEKKSKRRITKNKKGKEDWYGDQSCQKYLESFSSLLSERLDEESNSGAYGMSQLKVIFAFKP